jgi:hypothetical protein
MKLVDWLTSSKERRSSQADQDIQTDNNAFNKREIDWKWVPASSSTKRD